VVAIYNEVISGRQLCQCEVSIEDFTDCLWALSSGVNVISIMLACYVYVQSSRLPTIPHVVWTGADETSVYKYSMHI
jgi:hypothetical protein